MKKWKACLWLGLMLTQPWAASALLGAPTSIQVYFQDGTRIEHANIALRIPNDAQQIFFDIGDPTDEFPQHGSRVRYRLEWVDPDWQEKRDEVSVTVLFYNSIGDQIGQQIYNITGKSAGWNGSIERSTFTPHHESLTVPPGAEHLGMVISSAGPPTTVGAFVVADVRVVQDGGDAHSSETILDSRPFLQGTGPTSGWMRTGRHPSMAKLIPRPGAAPPAQAFCILDDDPTSYAEWTSVWQDSPRVTPDRNLSIDWNEIYDTGIVRWDRESYPMLSPGRYHFTVQEVDVLDHPLPTENTIVITVLPPYWKDPWFRSKCAFAAALAIFLGVRYRRHAQNRLHQQRVRLVEQERMRIARDLHDDLGARITHISLMSSFAGTNASPSETSAKFSEISTMARDLVASLSEVVWAVNPEKDHLESMVDYLCQLIQRLCQPTSFKCRIDDLTGSKDDAVSSQFRHQVVLAVKEAVNNAIKHSGGTELHISIRFEAPFLIISIADNGLGLPPDLPPDGNGIRNMRERIALLHGRIKIEGTPGKGTRVHFEVPISGDILT